MAIDYQDLFNGTAGALTAHAPDVGTAPWTAETVTSQFQLDGAGAVQSTTQLDNSIILTGDVASSEHRSTTVEASFGSAASNSRVGVGSRHSGSGAESDASRNGYLFWANDSGFVELRKLTAGVLSPDVGGFPGQGVTQIPITTPATDNVQLRLVTRNNGANVELEAWYNINAAGWVQIGGTYTDASPGVTFTDPGRDALLLFSSITSAPSALSFSRDVVAADVTAPTVTAFTINTPNVNDATVITIDAFTASDDTSVTGYKLTESATPPLAGDAGWAGAAQTAYDLGSYRSTTLYPWAKDAAGNVSAVYGTPIAVSASASGAPVVTNVAVADASLIDSHVFAVTITATDDVGVTGYAVTTSATPPGAAQQAGAVFSFDTGAFGDFNLYGWAFDAASNVSAQAAPVAVRSVDSTAVGATVFGLGFNGGINA